MRKILNRKKNKGFSKADLVYIVVLGLMIIGWKLVQKEKIAQPAVSSPGNDIIIQTQRDTNSTNSTNTPESRIDTKIIEGYLTIGEWGVKIKMKDADKVTYDYLNYSYAQYGQEASSVKIKVKDEFLKDKNCDFSVEWVRYQRIDDYLKEVAVKIGDYYFVSGNNPYSCTNTEDGLLYQSLLKDFNNIQSL